MGLITSKLAGLWLLVLIGTASLAGCGDGGDDSFRDPGTSAWELVPADRVADECGLDPDLLEAADEALGFPWAVVRYGKLCHEYYPDGADSSERFGRRPRPWVPSSSASRPIARGVSKGQAAKPGRSQTRTASIIGSTRSTSTPMPKSHTCLR